jgi:hypothetical protein
MHGATTKIVGSILLCCVILGFRREVDEKCALLSYYAASGGNLLLKFWILEP